MPRPPKNAIKAPVKKETDLITQEPIITPPVFVGGMTMQGAIEYIGQKIRMHRDLGRKVAWTEEDLYIRHQLIINWISTAEYRDKAREVQLARLERYMEECRLCGKYLEAAKFSEQIAKLTGTYQDNKKLEITSDKPISITFGE